MSAGYGHYLWPSFAPRYIYIGCEALPVRWILGECSTHLNVASKPHRSVGLYAAELSVDSSDFEYPMKTVGVVLVLEELKGRALRGFLKGAAAIRINVYPDGL